MTGKKLTALFLAMLLTIVMGCVPVVADEGAAVEATTITSDTDVSCEISYVISPSSVDTYTVTIPKKIIFTSTTPKVTVSATASLGTNKSLFVELESDQGNLTNGTSSISYSITRETYTGSTVDNPSGKIAVGKIVGSNTTKSFDTTLAFTLGSITGLPAGTYSDTLTFKTWVENSVGD